MSADDSGSFLSFHPGIRGDSKEAVGPSPIRDLGISGTHKECIDVAVKAKLGFEDGKTSSSPL